METFDRLSRGTPPPTNPLFHSLAVRASVTKRQISAHGIACSNKQTTNDVPLESLASFERVSFMQFTSATTRGRITPNICSSLCDH